MRHRLFFNILLLVNLLQNLLSKKIIAMSEYIPMVENQKQNYIYLVKVFCNEKKKIYYGIDVDIFREMVKGLFFTLIINLIL